MKLQIRYRHPRQERQAGVDYETIELDGPKPAFIIVVKGATVGGLTRFAESFDGTPAGKRLNGAPILPLPLGTEFEVWEVE